MASWLFFVEIQIVSLLDANRTVVVWIEPNRDKIKFGVELWKTMDENNI